MTSQAVESFTAKPAVSADVADARASGLFVHVALIFCLCLQRFCVYIGEAPLYLCLPVFLALLGWMMVTGRARIRRAPLWLFGAFAAIALVSTLLALNLPDARIDGISLPSLASIFLLYAGLVLGPGPRFDGSKTFDIFMFYVRLCAVLGIGQYAAQFAGLKLFAFSAAMPALAPVLVERLFNFHPVVAFGSQVLRSNGFFLVEPSTFSQLLMLGVVVDVFVRRQWRYLPLYGVAYLLTYAGTGALALVVAGALAVVVSPRTAPRMLGLGLAALVLAVAGSLVLPGAFGALAGRMNELNYSGSSGHIRYVSQLDLVSAIAGETRSIIGYGPGALERATFYIQGASSAALKLLVDYGLLGLASFAAFLTAALWRRDIPVVALFLLVDFQLGGGNLLFMPLAVLAATLCIWSAPVGQQGLVRVRPG